MRGDRQDDGRALQGHLEAPPWGRGHARRPHHAARCYGNLNPNPNPNPSPNPHPNPNPHAHPHPRPNPSPNPNPDQAAELLSPGVRATAFVSLLT